MTIQNSKFKIQSHSLKLKTFTASFIVFFFVFYYSIHEIFAVSPTASPSAAITPSENAQELLKIITEQAKDDIAEIKDKIENKAYVGKISEITDSTITLNNFRGKQRIRLDENTAIIGANKKEIKATDLALEDKIIAMGGIDENKTLEAKRVVVVSIPKVQPVKRIVYFGTITEINLKTSEIFVKEIKSTGQILKFKIDKTTNLIDQKDKNNALVLKDFEINQKLIVVYPEPLESKTPIAKTIFLLQ